MVETGVLGALAAVLEAQETLARRGEVAASS